MTDDRTPGMKARATKSDPESVFLTAHWRNLAMLNYEIEPDVLVPRVPAGTELDTYAGKVFVSIVGFLFLDTRVFGIPVPFHQNFEEVNLRFYVRRKTEEGSRRAVVFIKEFVPRSAIALVARACFGEPYSRVPMSHALRVTSPEGAEVRSVRYSWTIHGKDNYMELTTRGSARQAGPGSLEEFITDHYWGCSSRAGLSTFEYQVDHPRWGILEATEARLVCDAARLYGKPFESVFNRPPESAFLAEGSAVRVFRGTRVSS